MLKVESTKPSTPCRRCGQELTRQQGLDRPIRLRHLPILEQTVYLEIRPQQFQYRDCERWPAATQRLAWYEAHSPYTKALDRWLLKMLINATVADISRRCEVGYEAAEGALAQGVSTAVDWARFKTLETVRYQTPRRVAIA
ncbi:MAG: transposase family protein [Gammaproteobacteria bacterium]